MRIAHLKIALFALFAAAPVATLLLFGSVKSYGTRHADFPPIEKVLRGKKGQLDQLGDAILQRSAVRKLAIRLRSWVGYRVVGFVDTALIVSGDGGWLFYRPEFEGGHCLDPDETAAHSRKLGVLVDIGLASGIDMHVAMAPNKSTIYPELLNRFVRGYWKCGPENAATLRRLLKQEFPALIDHAEPLLTEKARRPDVPLYYSTDTHWTPYGGALALRQLLAAIHPSVAIPPPHVSGDTKTRRTDLGHMLVLSVSEPVSGVDPLPQQDLDALNRDSARQRTVIAHDSFYVIVEPQVRELLPGAVMIHAVYGADRLGTEVQTADRLIIELIERSLLEQVDRGKLNWSAQMPAAIVARNAKRARDCTSFTAAGRRADDAGAVVAVRGVAPRHMPCLRLSLTAKEPATLEIALPDAETGAFEPGRAFKYQVAPGSETIGFVLPFYAAGANVRLRVDGKGQPAISAIEIGEIEQPRLASSAP